MLCRGKNRPALCTIPNLSKHEKGAQSVNGAIAASALPSVLGLPTGPRIERLSRNKDIKHIPSLESVLKYHQHACLPSGSTCISRRRLSRLLLSFHFTMAVLQHPARPTSKRRGIHLQCPGTRTAHLLHSHMLYRPGPHPE